MTRVQSRGSQPRHSSHLDWMPPSREWGGGLVHALEDGSAPLVSAQVIDASGTLLLPKV